MFSLCFFQGIWKKKKIELELTSEVQTLQRNSFERLYSTGTVGVKLDK